MPHVSSFEGACIWHADCRNVHQSCCQRIEWSFLYYKPPPTSFWRIWQYVQPASQPRTTCNHASTHPASWPAGSSETRPWTADECVGLYNQRVSDSLCKSYLREAGISYGQQTQLHFIDGMHRDNVTRSWSPLSCHSSAIHHLIFQHDNARPHVARICTQFLDAENVSVLPWPAYSPDMSSTEDVWDSLDRCLRQRVPVHITGAEIIRSPTLCLSKTRLEPKFGFISPKDSFPPV